MSNKCTEVGAMQPLEERMEELGGGEFLEVFANNDTDGDEDDGGGSDDDVDDNGGWYNAAT